jgi:hypothetical protein
MTFDRWRRLEEIYHAALSREGEARAAFLSKSCAAADLQRDVESRLPHSQSGDNTRATDGTEP